MAVDTDEHFRVEGQRTWFDTINEMHAAPDKYLLACNHIRPHEGRRMNGRTPGVPGGVAATPEDEQNGRSGGTNARVSAPRPNRRHTGGGVTCSPSQYMPLIYDGFPVE